MPQLKDLTGLTFGRLTVLYRDGKRNGGAVWACACSCGATVSVKSDSLLSRRTMSCGCFRRDYLSEIKTKHGAARRGQATRTYRIWRAAKGRCTNPNSADYKNYGGRGIRMCESWANSFEAFLEDMGECPTGLSIDRIDNNGNYEPGNCRWATRSQQNTNQRPRKNVAASTPRKRAA